MTESESSIDPKVLAHLEALDKEHQQIVAFYASAGLVMLAFTAFIEVLNGAKINEEVIRITFYSVGVDTLFVITYSNIMYRKIKKEYKKAGISRNTKMKI